MDSLSVESGRIDIVTGPAVVRGRSYSEGTEFEIVMTACSDNINFARYHPTAFSSSLGKEEAL